MRTKFALLIVMVFAATALLAACDNFVEYTVINETDHELITWPFFKDCSLAADSSYDYFEEKLVKPRERFSYFRVHGRLEDPKCVQVMTKDRRLVLHGPYKYGGVYLVSEPLQPAGEPIPERDDLPDPSLGDDLRTLVEGPPLAVALQILGLLFALGFLSSTIFVLLVALFFTVRFLYRHYGGTS